MHGIVLIKGEGIKIQEAGPARKPGQIPAYHTHGLRQHYGTAKYHKRPDCAVLVRWKPGKCLGKTIMREWYDSYSQIADYEKCKRCF
jgi:hypothetical protein